MLGGVTRHMLPHLPGVPHVHVNRPLESPKWQIYHPPLWMDILWFNYIRGLNFLVKPVSEDTFTTFVGVSVIEVSAKYRFVLNMRRKVWNTLSYSSA